MRKEQKFPVLPEKIGFDGGSRNFTEMDVVPFYNGDIDESYEITGIHQSVPDKIFSRLYKKKKAVNDNKKEKIEKETLFVIIEVIAMSVYDTKESVTLKRLNDNTIKVAFEIPFKMKASFNHIVIAETITKRIMSRMDIVNHYLRHANDGTVFKDVVYVVNLVRDHDLLFPMNYLKEFHEVFSTIITTLCYHKMREFEDILMVFVRRLPAPVTKREEVNNGD